MDDQSRAPRCPSDVRSSVQIANDLGEQVVNLVPTRGGTAPAAGQRAPTCRRRRNQVPADVGQVVATATRLLQAIPAGNLNKLIGELATALQGNAATCARSSTRAPRSPRSSSPTSSSSPSCSPTRRPRSTRSPRSRPQLRQDLANTAALVQVLAQQKTGLHNLLTEGSSAFGAGGPARDERSRPISAASSTIRPTSSPTSPSRPTSPTCRRAWRTTSTSSAPSTTSRWPGLAKPTTSGSRTGPEPDLPAHPPRHPADPRRAAVLVRQPNTIPDVLPGRRLRDGRSAAGVGPATQPGFIPAAGGQRGGAHGPGGRRRAAVRRHRPSTSAAYGVPGAERGRCSPSA